MICKQCGSELSERAKFCTVCGSAVEENDFERVDIFDFEHSSEEGKIEKDEAADVIADSLESEQDLESSDESFSNKNSEEICLEEKPKKRKGLLIAGLIIALAVLLILVVPRFLKRSKYKKAVQFMNNEQYAEAEELFSQLDLFEDAQERLDFCRKYLQYETAQRYLEDKNYEDAYNEFEALGEFKDAREQAEYCENVMDYNRAEELFKAEKYDEAKELYTDLPSEDFPEANERYHYCVNKINYRQADKDYKNKKYYNAYQAFTNLGSFEDAKARAEQCIQSFPVSGETYHNKDHQSKEVSLIIVPPSNDGNQNYIKIYTDKNLLISCITIKQGEQAKVFLAPGNYRIKTAYGPEKSWFGEKDMFGDKGIYWILRNASDNKDVFSLQSGGIYTLTLRSGEDVPGEKINSTKENRKNF